MDYQQPNIMKHLFGMQEYVWNQYIGSLLNVNIVFLMFYGYWARQNIGIRVMEWWNNSSQMMNRMKKRVRVPIKVKFNIWEEEFESYGSIFYYTHFHKTHKQQHQSCNQLKHDVNLSMKDVPDMKQRLVTYYKYWMKVYMR